MYDLYQNPFRLAEVIGEKIGVAIGRKIGRRKQLIKLVNDKLLSIKDAAPFLNLSEEAFTRLLQDAEHLDHWNFEFKVPENLKITHSERDPHFSSFNYEQINQINNHIRSHPEWCKQLFEEPENDGLVEISFEYPVYEGETDAEARMRACRKL